MTDELPEAFERLRKEMGLPEPPRQPNPAPPEAPTKASTWLVQDKKRQCRLPNGKPKWAFPGDRSARLAVASTLARPDYAPRPGFILCAYECKICGRWHIGHLKLVE